MSFFGSLPTSTPFGAQAQPSIFSTQPSTTTSIFPSAAPATSTNIFSTASAAPMDNRLGGLANQHNIIASMQPGSSEIQNPIDGEVPAEILAQFEVLKKAMKENRELSEQFDMRVTDEECQRLNHTLGKVERFLVELRSEVKQNRQKNERCAELSQRDSRIASQVTHRHELLTKNPHYGRSQAVEYMHEIAGLNEQTLSECKATLVRLEQILIGLQEESIDGSSLQNLSQQDLAAHIRRFDQIFAAVSKQLYGVCEKAERLKDAYVERRRRVYGRFALDPFEKKRERERTVEAISSLKGLEAFPSQSAILTMNELMQQQRTQAPQGIAGSTSAFGGTFGGTSSSMFGGGGAKPFNSGFTTVSSAPFSFNPVQTSTTTSVAPFGSSSFGQQQPLTISTTASPFSKPLAPFGSTAGTGLSAFSTPATNALTGTSTSLFGQTSIGATAVTSAPQMSTFGSTMSSPMSGTLFKGSAGASAPFANSKPLFGK